MKGYILHSMSYFAERLIAERAPAVAKKGDLTGVEIKACWKEL